MGGMFSTVGLFDHDLSKWDVSSVANMTMMTFDMATSFNSDLFNWNGTSVTSMYKMFRNAMLYKSTLFNQDASEWDVSRVYDMESMFDWAASCNQDLSECDVYR